MIMSTILAVDMFETKDEFEDDVYAKAYGSLYINKMNELKEAITTGYTGQNNFNVFALEAGLGKSKAMIQAVDESLSDWLDTDLSFLIVKKFRKDVMQCWEYLEHHNTQVLGLTSSNWGSWKLKLDELRNIRVLIITHQRYVDLCLNDEFRQAFTENRQVLIIDEKLTFPMYTFSKRVYDYVRSILHTGIQQDFDKVCGRLLKELSKQELSKKKHSGVVRCEPKIHPRTLQSFKEIMEVNIENEIDNKKKNTLKNFMHGLDQWYSTKCLYNSGNITTFNRNHKLWGLDNNIILDASAGIDGIYSQDDFELFGEERIVDHSKSIFTIIDFNTSKSNLKFNESKFSPEVAEKIKNYHKPNDKTLIICHKDNHKVILEHLYKNQIVKIGVGDEYNDEDFAINWFGNLIGQNEYSEFTQCWIIGTPNLSYEQYLIHYEMYKQTDIGRNSTQIVHGRFKNADFKAVQIGYIAAEIYQSIKRIQRNAMPQGDFFIVNSDQQIVSNVLGQIKGAENQGVITLDFQQGTEEGRKQDNVDRFIEYIDQLPKGEYKKSDIVTKLGITNLGRILTDARVKALLPVHENVIGLGIINVKHKHIEKLTDAKEVDE